MEHVHYYRRKPRDTENTLDNVQTKNFPSYKVGAELKAQPSRPSRFADHR